MKPGEHHRRTDIMLVLRRTTDETIVIRTKGGERVEVTVVQVQGDKVRLGITAERSVEVWRKEIFDERERVAAEGVTP
jgi:carbon storage regulator